MNDMVKAIASELCDLAGDCGRCHTETCGPRLVATAIYNTHVKPLEDALSKFEAERDALAHKFAEVSDSVNGHNPAPTFCHACNICPANSDSELEGVTCEVRLREWASAEAQREGVSS